jgi:hypothetical protein
VVDAAIYDYFETVALDVDSTRAIVTEHATRQLADTGALRGQAEREAAKTEEALARVERDYLDGKLSVEKWERFEGKLTADLAGASAQIEQHGRQREAVEAQIAAIDAEAVVVKELAALRQAVAEEIQDGRGGDLDQLRAILRRLFVGFELTSPTARFGSGVLDGPRWVDAPDAENSLSFGGYFLLPVLRAEAVDLDRDDPAGFPAVRRLPLHANLCSLLASW